MTPAQQQELLIRSRNAFRVRDYESARQQLERLLEEAPHSVTANILMGIVAGRTGRPADAVRRFKTAINKDKKNAEAYNNLAVILRQMGRSADAYKAVRTAKHLSPDRADIHYNEGNILKDLGRTDAARAAYRRALSIDPRFVMAYNNLGNLHLAAGEPSRAIEMFSQGLAIDDNHPTLRYNLGLAYEEQGRLEEASGEYERSLKSRPGWMEALNNLGIVYQRQERFADAEHAFREIVHLDKKNAVARNNLATTYVLQGKQQQALSLFREAIELDPSYRRAASNLGQLLDEENTEDASSEELLRLGELDTGNTELQLRIARYCLRRSDLEGAQKTLLTVLSHEPEQVDALRMLAEVYHRSYADEQAAECYAKLRSIDPTYREHLLDRTIVLMERAEYDAALSEVERYLESHPGMLDAIMLKVDVLLEAGRSDEAVQILNELKELHPGDGRILASLARAHQLGGDRERAVQAAGELINLQGSRATHEDIAALNESLELYEKAVEAFAPERSEAWAQNLRRLGELSRPEEEESETPAPESDEMDGLDEDSIPILTFGGEELLEPEEWELTVAGVDEPEEEEAFGIDIPDSMAQSLTALPEEGQRRGGEPGGPGRLDGHGFETEAAPPEAWAPPDQTAQPVAPPQPPPQQQQQQQQQPPQPQPQYPSYPPAAPIEPAYQPPARGAGAEGAAAQQPTAPPPTEQRPTEQPPGRQAARGPAPQLRPVPYPIPVAEMPEESDAEESLMAEEPSLEEDVDAADDGEEESAEEPSEPEPEPEPEPPAEPTAEEPLAPAPAAEPVEPPTQPDVRGPAVHPRSPDSDTRARLLDYLDGLADSLPNEKRQEYLQSEARLRLEYLRSRMAGRPGLMHDVARYRSEATGAPPAAITPKRVAEAMSYIGKMSGYHPDAAIGNALRARVAAMLVKLQDIREKSS